MQMRRLAIGLACLAALLAGDAATASANTVPVTNNHDSGAGSLRQALLDVTSGGTIVIQPGIGQITLTTTELLVQKSMTINGAGTGDTVISGNNALRVFDLEGAIAVSISGVRITAGKVSGSAWGGGILVHNASLTLSNSLVDANADDTTGTGASNGGISQGGGIRVDPEPSSATLVNTTVSGNRALAGASGTGGGGIAQGGGISAEGSLTMRGGAVDGNIADVSSAAGGGIVGGAGLEYRGDANTVMSLDSVRVSTNAGHGDASAATGALVEGGGIFAGNDGGHVTISKVTVNANTLSATGGTNHNGGVVDGAGIAAASAATITNATVTGNSATANGQGTGTGGMAFGGGLVAGSQNVTVLNTTIDANTSAAAGPGGAGTVEGGNVNSNTNVRFKNSIVAAGVGGPGHGNCFGSAVSDGHNIDTLDQCGFHFTGDRVNTDPMLGPLKENGGPVETMAPRPGPAIDGGDNNGCPATDARGVLRPAGPACDVGAFELGTPGAVTGPASGIGTGGATLNGTARNPDLGGGSVVFQFGTTTAYGSSTAAQPIGPTTAGAPFAAAIGGLAPNTTYHFREVVSNSVATTFGADQSFTTAAPSAAVISGASQTHTKWRRGNHLFSIARRRPPVGTTFKFRLDKSATVRFDFTQSVPGRKVRGRCVAPNRRNKHKHKCSRTLVRGTLSFGGHAGVNSVHFEGRVSRTKTLKPGKYRLVITAITPGVGSTTQTLRFTIVR